MAHRKIIVIISWFLTMHILLSIFVDILEMNIVLRYSANILRNKQIYKNPKIIMTHIRCSTPFHIMIRNGKWLAWKLFSTLLVFRGLFFVYFLSTRLDEIPNEIKERYKHSLKIAKKKLNSQKPTLFQMTNENIVIGTKMFAMASNELDLFVISYHFHLLFHFALFIQLRLHFINWKKAPQIEITGKFICCIYAI